MLGFGLISGTILFIAVVLLKHEGKFLITDKRVICKFGILSKNIKESSFDKVTDTFFSQGLFGRMFNYGNIRINTASGSNAINFIGIIGPSEIQTTLNTIIKKYQKVKNISKRLTKIQDKYLTKDISKREYKKLKEKILWSVPAGIDYSSILDIEEFDDLIEDNITQKPHNNRLPRNISSPYMGGRLSSPTFCPECDNYIEEGLDYCVICGTKLSPKERLSSRGGNINRKEDKAQKNSMSFNHHKSFDYNHRDQPIPQQEITYDEEYKILYGPKSEGSNEYSDNSTAFQKETDFFSEDYKSSLEDFDNHNEEVEFFSEDISILKMRLAKGEITKEEYEELKSIIEE